MFKKLNLFKFCYYFDELRKKIERIQKLIREHHLDIPDGSEESLEDWESDEDEVQTMDIDHEEFPEVMNTPEKTTINRLLQGCNESSPKKHSNGP